jgi:hypothetical protein
VAPLTLDDEDLALLEHAADDGSPVARGARGRRERELFVDPGDPIYG